MNAQEEIVDRAIEYTDTLLRTLPTYRDAAVESLRKLRAALAERFPGDSAVGKLDVYLGTLAGGAADPPP